MFVKFFDENMKTYKGFQWQEGVKHTTSGEGNLCSAGWIHLYDDPLVAVFMNPIHGKYDLSMCQMRQVDVGGLFKYDGEPPNCFKLGVTELIPREIIPIPEMTLTQRVAIGIYSALQVCSNPLFIEWGTDWLSGKDRTSKATWATWAEMNSATGSATGSAAVAVAAAMWATTWAAMWSVEDAVAKNVVVFNFPLVIEQGMKIK